MSNPLTDTTKNDEIEIDESFQEEANQWYDDMFTGKDRYNQIEQAWNSGGKYAEELQDELYGFVLWATYHELEQKQWFLQLGQNIRLSVITDLKGNIYTVDFQYQNDYEPWTSAENQDKDLLIKYATVVGLYEE